MAGQKNSPTQVEKVKTGLGMDFSPDPGRLPLVIQKVNLLEICMIKSRSELGSRKIEREDSVRQYQIAVDVVETKPISNDFWVICRFGLREKPKNSEQDVDAELYKIEASFQLFYSLKDRKGINKNDILNFGVINGPYNAWSFWREFVQNTCLRMGIGPVVVPLKPPPVPSRLALRGAQVDKK